MALHLGSRPAQGDLYHQLTLQPAIPVPGSRGIVDARSVGTTAAGLRDYEVEVLLPGGRWETVTQVSGECRYHV